VRLMNAVIYFWKKKVNFRMCVLMALIMKLQTHLT
jgi:hypothetical protein